MNSSSPAGVIVLVRHGPSSHVSRGWVDRSGVERDRVLYDAAGIMPDSAPPPELQRIVAGATQVVSSDLPRAVESCRRLVGDRTTTTSPLLREIPLAIPPLDLRLPLAAWESLIHLTWAWDIARHRDLTSAQRQQVQEASTWLVTMAHRESKVVAVTHGAVRRAIGEELRTAGWQRRHAHGGYRPWSAWTYERSRGSR